MTTNFRDAISFIYLLLAARGNDSVSVGFCRVDLDQNSIEIGAEVISLVL